MYSPLRSDDDSFHNYFIDNDWNLESIKNYFGAIPKILNRVLLRRSCSVDIVKLLLKEGANINCHDKYGYSPLMIALEYSNDAKVIRVLLEAGAKINKVDGCGRTPLLRFLQREDCVVGIVEVLLDYKADVNRKDVYGYSPLATAIRIVKDDAVIRVLVERGAEVNDLRNLRNTPLLVLLRERKNCSVDTVKLLLAKGADVNYMGKCGYSPLVTALIQSRDETVIQTLLENGANVNIVCEDNKTPLLLYLDRRYIAGNDCSVGIVKLLLHYKAKVNYRNSYGNSPLVTALENQRDKVIIQMLLEGGAGVNIRHRSGKSSLCIAFRHSSNDIVKLLLDAGSSTNACKYHRSALNCATDFSCSGLREDILKLLLEANLDVNSVNEYGQSVLCYAVQHGAKANDIQLLLDAGVSLNTCMQHSSPLICATGVCLGRPLRADVVQLLFDNGACVDDKGLEILQGALLCCNYETGAIQLLLDLPGMYGYVFAKKCEESLLHLAVKNPNCKLDAIKLLVKRKAQVHLVNHRGDTPLHCAVRNKTSDPSIINFLLQNGSPVNTKNDSNVTPLILAVEQQCHFNIITELLIAGAYIGKGKFYQEFTLLEFLARAYESCEDPVQLKGYNILVKFFLLQHPECDIGDFQHASVEHGIMGVTEFGIKKLKDFVEKCLNEQRIMEVMQVGHEHTFLEFVTGKLDEKNYELGQLLNYMSKHTFPGVLDNILSFLPVFQDIIFARVKKVMIEQKYCPGSLSVGRVKLDNIILYKIATFLSDDDFLRFILAFYQGIHYDSDKVLLSKRSSEPSTKLYKYQKEYH